MAQSPENNPFADLDQRLEEIFEKADDYMINKKSYKDAVGVPKPVVTIDRLQSKKIPNNVTCFYRRNCMKKY